MSFSYRILLLLWLLPGAAAQAQNIPDGNSTAPGGAFSTVPQPPDLSQPTGTQPSYIRTYVPKVPVTDANAVNGMGPELLQTGTVYKDGFNRTIQAVQHYATTGSKPHLVQPYDTRFQAEGAAYLPYPDNQSGYSAELFGKQAYYYTMAYPAEVAPYSIGRNLSDDQQRAVKSLAPGRSLAGQNRGVTVKKVTNTAGEVKIWEPDAGGLPYSPGTYPAGSLFGELSYDTMGAQVLSYTDMDGRVICRTVKQQDQNTGGGGTITISGTTYYVYNETGSLRGVLPPKATAASGSSVAQAVWDKLCFQYTYDTRGRKIEQKFPGKDKEYFVYDNRNRLVLYQDGNLRAQNNWSFTAYDALDRPLFSGLYYTSTESRVVLQGYFTDGIAYSDSYLIHYLKDYDMMATYPNGPANTTVLQRHYYDDYSISDPNNDIWNACTAALLFNNDLLSTPGNETPQRAAHQQGKVTATLTKILPAPGADASKTGDWRQVLHYYDVKGRLIYTAGLDFYQGNPIHAHFSGMQYDFADRPLVTKHVMQNANGTTQLHKEWTFNEYDANTGKLTKTWHRSDNGAWNQQALYSYDPLGRVSRKVLGDYGEVQDYNYNIRGKLEGINAHYARTGDKQGESRSFGQSLAYDYGFSQPRYDGKLAGVLWRGAGGTQAALNAYGYSYDYSGRLTHAEFRRYEPPSGSYLGYAWRKDLADYTTSNLAYDRDGNLLSMQQRSVKPGTGLVTMDDLNYTYEDGGLSDRLQQVTDNAAFYDLGDFNNTNGSATDYAYDANGNLVLDNNKGITNVTYTHFNKPQVVTLGGDRTILYSYDAAGNKVQELVLDPAEPQKRTDYVGNYIYRNDVLQYALTGEGRSVYDAAAGSFKEEYFVKDHLGNVRSVVEVYVPPVAEYLATHEVASANLEGLFFENMDEVRDDKPGGSLGDSYAASLNGAHASRRIGTSMLLHVMAGDKVEMNVNNYYETYDNGQDDPVSMEDMLGTIVNTLVGGQGGFPGGGEGHETKAVTDAFTLENFAQYNELFNGEIDENRPRAYLNYVLFDEEFNLVQEMSGAFQANGAGNWTQIGTTAPMEIPRNGYLAVYLSNASSNAAVDELGNVYFDQLVIRFSRGKLKEEVHYYPHGLPIAGMGSAATGMKENRHRYQGNEYRQDAGLNWMDFNHRQYDPQIGRFLSVDPLASYTYAYSSYIAMNNNPASLTDPNGLQVGDNREMAWGNRHNQFLRDAYLIDAQEYLNTNHIAEFIAQNPWASGANASITTLYGDRARSFFAALTGQSFTGGGVDAEEAGPQKGFTDEQVQQAGWTITGENEKEYFASRWVVNNGDIKTLHKEFGRFQKPPSANEQNDQQLGIGWWSDFAAGAGKANWWSTIGVTIGSQTPGSFRLRTTTRGFSPKYYANAWRGNQYAKTFNISKVGRFASRGLVGVGIAFDYVSYRRGDITLGKFVVNTGMGIFGLTGVGTVPAIFYFGAESFVPGGAAHVMDVANEAQTETQRILGPGWRLVPFGPK